MTYDEDDDAGPPPLSSLADQVQALSSEQTGARRPAIADEDDSSLPIASTTVIGGKAKEPSKPTLKKGFFDSKPARDTSKAASSSRPAGDSKPAIEELKGKKGGLGGPSIPDFLRVEPDADNAKRLQEVKGKLVEALKPTPELMSSVMTDPRAMAGFEDPEVMAAVNEISKDPTAMKKYKDNKKVAEFYQSMALVMGNRLETMENKPL